MPPPGARDQKMRPATLRTHVTFRTSRFNQTEVRPYFINPNCFGDDRAAWLVSGLHERGWTDLSEPWQEDWGWQTSTARGGRKYLISVGSTEEDAPGWLVHVQEHTGLLARLRGKAGPGALRELLDAIHQVLMTGPEVEHIRWHFEDVFMGDSSAGAREPMSPRTDAEVASRRRRT
jgi:hypothetical protein